MLSPRHPQRDMRAKREQLPKTGSTKLHKSSESGETSFTRSSANKRRGRLQQSNWLPLLSLATLGLSACTYHCDDCGGPVHAPDVTPPAAPQGVYSMTGDGNVSLYWYPNTELDLDGYRVYRGETSDGYHDWVATLNRSQTQYVDQGLANGKTYYYAIAAFDDSGNEGDLSVELVHDTPRPQGFSLVLDNAATRPATSGYDFSSRRVVDYRDLEADIYFWFTEDDGFWMVATERSNDEFTDIQDDGFRPIHDVDWAPDGGWAPTGDVPLISGHSYVVWTWDDHFAKLRVEEIEEGRVVIDWAYQVDRGNPELSRGPTSRQSVPRAGSGDREHRVGPKRR